MRLQALLRPCDTLVLARDWCPELWRGGGAKLTWRDKWGACNHTSLQTSWMTALTLTLTPTPTPNPTLNPNLTPNPNQVQISFMAAAPGHAFFRCALQRAVRNIETGHYGPGDLSLSLSLSLSLPLTLTLRRATTGQVISLSRGRRSLAPASTR